MDQVDYARGAAPAILTWYEEYFNVPFPLPKQDMIALPDFSAGAMENWGLITYRYLLNNECCKNDLKRLIAKRIHIDYFYFCE